MPEDLLSARERSKELETRLAKVNKEVTEANQRENELRTAVGKKDKEVGLIKLELKELQRKGEQDQESRKKAESEKQKCERSLTKK